MKAIPGEFYIHSSKYQELADKAFDWFIKGLKFKSGSDEWMICILKENIYRRQALKHLKEAQKKINEIL